MSVPEFAYTFTGRLETFECMHHLPKRRASAARKRGPATAKWPHKSPSPHDLAFAGFFYKPTATSVDNVMCFMCHRNLDGWEETDNPINEHCAFSPDCAWANCCVITLDCPDEDPLSPRLIEMRSATFGDRWPHESKRAWRCKVNKMVEAGWIYDPSPENDDGVTCLYCNLSLDGWEPKDNPMEEHRKRSAHCKFFQLINKFATSRSAASSRSRTIRSSNSVKLSHASNLSNPTESFDALPPLANALNTMKPHKGIQNNTTSDSIVRKDEVNSSNMTGNRTCSGTRKRTSSTVSRAVHETAQGNPLDSTEVSISRTKKRKSKLAMDNSSMDSAILPQISTIIASPPATRVTRSRKTSQQYTGCKDAVDLTSSVLAQSEPKRTIRRKKAVPTLRNTKDSGKSYASDSSGGESYNSCSSKIINDIPAKPNKVVTREPALSLRGLKRARDGSRKAASMYDSPAPDAGPSTSQRGGTIHRGKATSRSDSDKTLMKAKDNQESNSSDCEGAEMAMQGINQSLTPETEMVHELQVDKVSPSSILVASSPVVLPHMEVSGNEFEGITKEEFSIAYSPVTSPSHVEHSVGIDLAGGVHENESISRTLESVSEGSSKRIDSKIVQLIPSSPPSMQSSDAENRPPSQEKYSSSSPSPSPCPRSEQKKGNQMKDVNVGVALKSPHKEAQIKSPTTTMNSPSTSLTSSNQTSAGRPGHEDISLNKSCQVVKTSPTKQLLVKSKSLNLIKETSCEGVTWTPIEFADKFNSGVLKYDDRIPPELLDVYDKVFHENPEQMSREMAKLKKDNHDTREIMNTVATIANLATTNEIGENNRLSPDQVGHILYYLEMNLSAEEKAMTLDQWVQYNAIRCEERLRWECEQMVRIFEREGRRALDVLEDLRVVKNPAALLSHKKIYQTLHSTTDATTPRLAQ